MASVRFICGTQAVHKELEARLSRFIGIDDTILYSSCFDANGGLFETLLDEQDAVISDALNHASIIDGSGSARRAASLRERRPRRARDAPQGSADARVRLIVTDGVFSMDGVIARLGRSATSPTRYGALVMVDDSHASGFIGRTGRGTPEPRT
jgi:glycine C-acetyltransferase